MPAMAFYGLTGDAWDAVAARDRERMLGTVPVLNDIAQSDTDADAVRACGRWQDRLACVEHCTATSSRYLRQWAGRGFGEARV